MIGIIDLNYIECYHNNIIPLEVLFLLCSYIVSIDIIVDQRELLFLSKQG